MSEITAITLKDAVKQERGGRYRNVHTLYTAQVGGSWFGVSNQDEGYQSFKTYYGRKTARSANLNPADGFASEEEAIAHIKEVFRVVAVTSGGWAVFHGKGNK